MNPQAENILIGDLSIEIQNDTQSDLSVRPSPSMYSLGTSYMVRMITYAGKGKIILTTEVKLRLHGKKSETFSHRRRPQVLGSHFQFFTNGGHSQEP